MKAGDKIIVSYEGGDPETYIWKKGDEVEEIYSETLDSFVGCEKNTGYGVMNTELDIIDFNGNNY